MSRIESRLLLAAVMLLASASFCGANCEAQTSDGPVDAAIKATKPLAEVRMRYEHVDQEEFSEPADAMTYRLRAGFETGAAWNTTLLVEFEHVDELLGDFNSILNGQTGFPVVPDPDVTELNRLQLTNTSLPGTVTTIGRQRIVMDDSRFVGNAGFRQNEQTFDAVRIQNTSLGSLTLDAAYLTQVNRIFGDDSPLGRWHGDSVLLNVGLPTPAGRLSTFAYLIDVNEGGGANASQTYGFRLSGNKDVTIGRLGYAASLAKQTDYASSSLDYSANYYALDASLTAGKVSLGLGAEILSSDGLQGFQTPLATLHKFQGWADKFLVTPAAGVEDIYASASYSAGDVGPLTGVRLVAVYHDFSPETGGSHYGDEIDFLVTAKWKILSLSVKYANYNADRFATDTQKIWLEASYDF